MPSNSYSLDDIRKELDKKFETFSITADGDEFVFRPILRMPKTDRESLRESLTELNAIMDRKDKSPEEQDFDKLLATVESVITRAVKDDRGGRLVELIDGDASMLMEILSMWVEATNPGEASSSPEPLTSTASS